MSVKRMDREKVVKGLEFTKAMITFNPSTGEDIEPGNLNEENKTTYDACVGAIAMLKDDETRIQYLKDHIAMCKEEVERLYKKQETQKFFVDESGEITPLPVVVRCKDCKHGKINICDEFATCYNDGSCLYGNTRKSNWFCADGVKKDDGG